MPAKKYPRTFVERHCETCGSTFFPRACDTKRGEGRFCTRRCVGYAQKRLRRAVVDMKGSKNPNFKNWSSKNKIAYKNRFRAKYPEKARAHDITKNAIARGDLQRPDACQHCREKVHVDAHHEDYSRPLDVMWFCRPCHIKHHAEIRAQKRQGSVAA